jgi:hypothetical protein
MDRLRKQVQNKAKLEKEREEACLKVMMKPLNHYFKCQRIVDTLTTEVLNETVSDNALLDVNEELDLAMRDMTRDTAIHTSNATLTDRERLQHLVKTLESRKGVNMAKQHQHAHAFLMFESSIREKKMSELQASRHVAETCYGDQRERRSNASSGKQWYRHRARAIIVGAHHKHAESELITVVLSEQEREQWLTELKHVLRALNQGLYSIRSPYYCRDDVFEILLPRRCI